MSAQKNAKSVWVAKSGHIIIPKESWNRTPSRRYARGPESYLFDFILKYNASVRGSVRVFLEYDVTFHVPQLGVTIQPGPLVMATGLGGMPEVSGSNVAARNRYKSARIAGEFAKRLSLTLSDKANSALKALKVFFTSGEAAEDSGNYAMSFKPEDQQMVVENNSESEIRVYDDLQDSQDPMAQVTSRVYPHTTETIPLSEFTTFVAELPGLTTNVHIPDEWVDLATLLVDNIPFF